MSRQELSGRSIVDQVDALQSFLLRGGSALTWFGSKDFTRADVAAIEAERKRRNLATPLATRTA